MKGGLNFIVLPDSSTDLDQAIIKIQQMNIIQRMALDQITMLSIHDALRFNNIFQIVGYVATRDLELALSFESERDIEEYYENHQDLLEQAIDNLRFRETTSQMTIVYTDSSSVQFVEDAANISEPHIITIDNSNDPFFITVHDLANRLSVLYGSTMAEKARADVAGDSMKDSSI